MNSVLQFKAKGAQGEGLESLYQQLRYDLRFECVADIAERCSLHRTTLIKWCNNSTSLPRAGNIVRVATELGYRIYWQG